MTARIVASNTNDEDASILDDNATPET